MWISKIIPILNSRDSVTQGGEKHPLYVTSWYYFRESGYAKSQEGREEQVTLFFPFSNLKSYEPSARRPPVVLSFGIYTYWETSLKALETTIYR